MPIFNHLIFDGKTVHAYNDVIGIVDDLPTNGAFALHGQTLLGVLRSLRSKEVDLIAGEHEVTVRTQSSRVKLPYLPKSSFVFEEPEERWQQVFHIDDDFLQGLDLCLSTVAKDYSLPALMGVFLSVSDSGVLMYSCNGDTISRVKLKPPKGIENSFLCVIPAAFGEVALKMFKDAHSPELALSETWAALSCKGPSLYGRIVSTSSPLDHEKLITDTLQGKPTYVPVPNGLEAMLERAMVITGKHSSPTTLTVADGVLDLFTTTPMGEVRDRVRLTGHPDVVAKVNADAVRQCIAACDEMAILSNCTAYKNGVAVLQVLANMGA